MLNSCYFVLKFRLILILIKTNFQEAGQAFGGVVARRLFKHFSSTRNSKEAYATQARLRKRRQTAALKRLDAVDRIRLVEA